jgi:hypothetical protein
MVPRMDVRIGGFYVGGKGWMVREVVGPSPFNPDALQYRTYRLDTGARLPEFSAAPVVWTRCAHGQSAKRQPTKSIGFVIR